MTLSGDFMLLASAALLQSSCPFVRLCRMSIITQRELHYPKLSKYHIYNHNHINEKITCCYGANAYDERSHASASKS